MRLSRPAQVEARRVNHAERPAPPVGDAVQAVARQPGLLFDDGLLPADQPVEEGRLANVRATDDGDDGPAHACMTRALAASPTRPVERPSTGPPRIGARPPV